MTKEELNAQLLAVCLAKEVDYARAEELLRQGAEPLGRIENWSVPPHPENLYTAILDELRFKENIPEDICKITELFLRYGMDITKPSVPYDSDSQNPLCSFASPPWYPDSFCPDESEENELRTLKLLLDHGLQAKDANACWMEYICTIRMICDFDNAYDLGILRDYLRKLMLIASYPHVLEAAAELREEIRLERNHYDLTRFRNWRNFSFEVDFSRCESFPSASRSVVTIIEKSSGQKVWTFGIDLQPEDI